MAMSHRPSTRRIDWRSLVRFYDENRQVPYPTYQFSNGRDFKDRNDPGKLPQSRWKQRY